MASPKIVHELEIKFGNAYGPDDEQAVLETLRKNAPTSGDACIAFEKDFSAYCNTQYARCVSNGTAALFLSLIGVGIKPGDVVLTTPITWIATAAAGATLGAEVGFVDVDPVTYNLDPSKVEEMIAQYPAGKVKAVLPVHLYGQCCDMDPLLALGKKHGFVVIEDACHAVGATYKGRMAGSMGVTGCFSFHEQKNMSTLGEGGMITTSDAAVYERIALYRSHCARVYGKSTKYCTIDETKFPMGKRFWGQDFDDCGYNFRLTDIQAAVGSVQLKKLDQFNQSRIDNAAYLSTGLEGVPGLTLPKTMPDCKHVFHLYPVLIDPAVCALGKEDFICAMLNEKGIRVGTHYNPLNWTQAFQKRGFKRGQFPVAEGLAERLVTLPIHPRLTKEGMDYLIASVKALLQK